jgi:plastocyanin
MKKLAPAIIALLLMTGAFIVYAKLPQVKNAISDLTGKSSPTPYPRVIEENTDPADLEDNAKRSDKSEEEKVLYGETYLDDKRVTINLGKFSPETLTIKAGTTVIWTNRDKLSHAVIVDNGAQTPPLSPNKEGAIIFRLPGTYTYRSGAENSMTGTVIVEE